MRRRIQLLIAGFALTAVSACRDNPSAPAEGALGFAQGEPAFAKNGPVTYKFTIDQAGGTYEVGPFTLTIPANSVCDEASGYGPGTWHQPCTGTRGDVEMEATFSYERKRLWVDFQPAIRFDPSNRPTISTTALNIRRVEKAFKRNPAAFRFATILYAPSIGSRPVNDARLYGDPDLRTVYDFKTGTISRKFLHFSGYNLFWGYACTPSPDDPYCVEGDPPAE